MSINRKSRFLGLVLTPLLSLTAGAQATADYGELNVVKSNIGFAHMTRGVNMYTLVALRSCVSTKDIGVLDQMLKDTDPTVRIASAYVLVDLGAAGKQAVTRQLDKTASPAERATLTEALSDAASANYQPILQYPLTKAERRRIRGCA